MLLPIQIRRTALLFAQISQTHPIDLSACGSQTHCDQLPFLCQCIKRYLAFINMYCFIKNVFFQNVPHKNMLSGLLLVWQNFLSKLCCSRSNREFFPFSWRERLVPFLSSRKNSNPVHKHFDLVEVITQINVYLLAVGSY